MAAATGILRADVEATGPEELAAPSRLDGWTRAHVVAHLAYGAAASRRVTDAALGGEVVRFYPGGAAEREASIRQADELDATVLVDELAAASSRLAERWEALPPEAWATAVEDDRLGAVRLARYLVLRWTEVEVHRTDLGRTASGWSPAFVATALPLRVAWLPVHQRRAGFDPTVRARWLLVARDVGAWLVSTDGPEAAAGAAAPDEDADVRLTGAPEEVLAVLLGRARASSLAVDGDAALAERLHDAFPGP